MKSKLIPQPRILLIDDDPTFGMILSRLAQAKGVPLRYYSSAREAYRQVDDLKADLALIDFNLGEVNGVQLSRHVERIAGKIPTILISSMNVPGDIVWPESVSHFISKKEGAERLLLQALEFYRALKAEKPAA